MYFAQTMNKMYQVCHHVRMKRLTLSSPGRCHPSRSQLGINTHCWHWCCSFGNCSSTSAQHRRVVDCLWCWERLLVHCCTRDSLNTWSRSMYCITSISCLHRVWYCVIFWRSGEENSMGNLESLWWHHPSILCIGHYSRVEDCWGIPGEAGVICCLDVWQNKWSHLC